MRSGNHHQRTGNVVINSEFKIPNSEFETARLKEPWKGGVMNLDATIPTHRGNQVDLSQVDGPGKNGYPGLNFTNRCIDLNVMEPPK